MTVLQLIRHFVAQNATSAASEPVKRDACGQRTHTTPRRQTDLEVGGAADLAFSAGELQAEFDPGVLI
ncbi:MAG TPA: hypothetical protein VG167_02525 [Verrucomicrobiae bacterium]|nr:hypothetical protein [Verrucomicrobiae bacterium]